MFCTELCCKYAISHDQQTHWLQNLTFPQCLPFAGSFIHVCSSRPSFTHPRWASQVWRVNTQYALSQMSHTIQYISSSALMHSRATAGEPHTHKTYMCSQKWTFAVSGKYRVCCLNYESQKSPVQPDVKLLSVFILWEPSLSFSHSSWTSLALTLINWVISLQRVINILFKCALTKEHMLCRVISMFVKSHLSV